MNYRAYGPGSFEQEFTTPLNRTDLTTMKGAEFFGTPGTEQFETFRRLFVADGSRNTGHLYLFNHRYASINENGAFVAVRFLTSDDPAQTWSYGFGYAQIRASAMSLEQKCVVPSPSPTPYK